MTMAMSMMASVGDGVVTIVIDVNLHTSSPVLRSVQCIAMFYSVFLYVASGLCMLCCVLYVQLSYAPGYKVSGLCVAGCM